MSLSNHQLAMTVLMTPDVANFAGNVHSGHIYAEAAKTRKEVRRELELRHSAAKQGSAELAHAGRAHG